MTGRSSGRLSKTGSMVSNTCKALELAHIGCYHGMIAAAANVPCISGDYSIQQTSDTLQSMLLWAKRTEGVHPTSCK